MTRRPKGSNADEWAMFLAEHKDAAPFVAVQIAEAIEAVGMEPSEAEIEAALVAFVAARDPNGTGLNWALALRAALVAAAKARKAVRHG